MANTNSINLEEVNSQYLSISDASQTNLEITGDITLECWVNQTSTPSSQRVFIAKFSSGVTPTGGYIFNQNIPGVLKFVINDFGVSEIYQTSYELTNGEWQHLAVSWDSSAAIAKFYINGVLYDTVSGTKHSIGQGGAYFTIGALNQGISPVQFFDGKIDEVRVWSDVRTAEEIASNYNTILVGNEDNLRGYWRLDGNLLDQTANNNDLTNNNSATFSPVVPFAESRAEFKPKIIIGGLS